MSPWVLLFLAGLAEIGWAIGLKYTDGFSKLWPSVGTAAAMLISVVLLGLAMRTLPVGTAYALYALWVCWSHEQSSKAFERSIKPKIS